MPKRIVKSVSLPPKLVKMAEDYCNQTGISFSELMRHALIEKLAELMIMKKEKEEN